MTTAFKLKEEPASQAGPQNKEKWLALYTNYLKLIAESQLDRRLRRRISPSDLVQDTLFEAHRDWDAFRGETEAERLSWLRRILVHNLIEASQKHLVAERRDVRREVYFQNMQASVEQSSSRLEHFLNGNLPSPSAVVLKRERIRLLADALAELSPVHRQVIVLRHIEGMPFNEIALEIDRTSGACRMIWLRAIEQLREKLQRFGIE